jgi:hypothetical protein
MQTRTDKLLPILTALFVGGLAIVAGAISYAHMQNLALHHDQLGWKANAFPISVDGIEVVASLHILAQRRAGRPAGWLPWVALLVGTIASLAANVAVSGHDPVGRVLAGWPAVSLLVSIKLLSSMFDHTDGPATVPDDHRTVPTEAGPSPPAGETGTAESIPETSGANSTPSGAVPPAGRSGAVADSRDVAHLIPAARAARDALTANGHTLSRDRLADRMREDGYGVSNARAGLLVQILKAETHVTQLGSSQSPADAADLNAHAS